MNEITETTSYNSIINSNYILEDTTILKTSISYYYFLSSNYKESIEKINKYMDLKIQEEILKYTSEKCVSLNDYFYLKEQNFPYHTHEIISKSFITLNELCLLCFYFDNYSYYGGAHGMTVRESYNFDLRKGKKLKLSDIVKIDPKVYILPKLEEEIEKNKTKYEGVYSKDALYKYFNKENFYLTNNGLTIYYGLYEIAPYASGIITFTLPYDEYIIKPSCH